MDIDEMLAQEMQSSSGSGFQLPSAATREGLLELIQKARTLEAEVELLELQLKEKKTESTRLTDIEIPALLAEWGTTKWRSGAIEVEVVDNIQASITKERSQAAFDWLRDNGYDDLIKNQVIASFGRGEDEDAEKLAHEISVKGAGVVEQRQFIEPPTLKKFVKDYLTKERADDEPPLPEDVFGVFRGKRAKIKVRN